MRPRFPFHLCSLFIAVLWISSAVAAPLRVLVLGNSFSQNSTKYLVQIAQSSGHEIVLTKAETGGCPLEKHWKALEADLAHAGSKEAKIYGPKSLLEIMGNGQWDVITLQQYSLFSGNPETYEPYAGKLRESFAAKQPQAELVIHQTWAYRSDAPRFSQVGGDKSAANQAEMRDHSRAAYWKMATDLGARVIPVGDAFATVNADPAWSFRPDPAFKSKAAVAPQLPNQAGSLNIGYRWDKDGKLTFDANHANVAGEYLGGLVWYGFLFQASPEAITYVPDGVDPKFAAFLRQVAARTLKSVEAENAKVRAGSSRAQAMAAAVR